MDVITFFWGAMETIVEGLDFAGKLRDEPEMKLKWGLEERKLLVWLKLQVAEDAAVLTAIDDVY